MSTSAPGFQRLALALPHVEQKSHFGKDDFRVKNKVFATIPEAGVGVVKLKPDQQALFLETAADAFQPVKGAWGKQGWTRLRLARLSEEQISAALELAWRNVAQKRMLAAFDAEPNK